MPRLSPDSPLPPPSKHFIHICYDFNEFVTINFFFFFCFEIKSDGPMVGISNGGNRAALENIFFFFSEFCLTFVAVTETSSGEANWKWFENEKASGSKRFFFFLSKQQNEICLRETDFFLGSQIKQIFKFELMQSNNFLIVP